jgi:hypothetical protein
MTLPVTEPGCSGKPATNSLSHSTAWYLCCWPIQWTEPLVPLSCTNFLSERRGLAVLSAATSTHARTSGVLRADTPVLFEAVRACDTCALTRAKKPFRPFLAVCTRHYCQATHYTIERCFLLQLTYRKLNYCCT